jgi:hypothetical protein
MKKEVHNVTSEILGLKLFVSPAIIQDLSVGLASDLTSTLMYWCPIVVANFLCSRGVVFKEDGSEFRKYPLI